MKVLYLISLIASLFLVPKAQNNKKIDPNFLMEGPNDGLTVKAFPSEITIPINGNIKNEVEKVEIRLFEYGVWNKSVKPSIIDYDPLDLFPIYKTNSEKVLTHQIKFYMEEYSYYFETIEITINVKDITAPVISNVPRFVLNYGDKKPNLLDGVAVSDDLTPENKIKVTVEEVTPINVSKLGTYKLIYIAIDEAGNESFKESELIVQDVEAPNIIKIKEPILEEGDLFRWEDYYNITDNYPGVVNVEVSKTSFPTPGSYAIIITAKDQSNNITTFQDTVVVLEKVPEMRIKSSELKVEYGTLITDDWLIQNNVLGVNFFDVFVVGNYDSNKVGTYNLSYEHVENNEVIQTLDFKLIIKDTIPPTITLKKDLVVPYGTANFVFSDYFIIKDNYDSFSNLKITKKGTINVNKLGRYEYQVTIEDSSENKYTEVFVFEVKDVNPPEILNLPSKLEVQQGNHIDLSFLEIADNYDKSPSYEVIINEEYLNKVGLYETKIITKDSFNNQKAYFLEVEVIDNEPPEIILHSETLTFNINSEPIDYIQIILEVVDGNNYIDPSLVVVDDNVNYNKIGIYEVFFSISDENGNEGAALLKVTVDDFKKPIINLTNIKVEKGDTFDMWEGVEIIDDSPIKIKKTYPTTINLNEAGTYEVHYYVSDERGNYSSATRIVEVVDTKAKYKTPIYIGVTFLVSSLLTTIALFGLKYFKKRR